MHCSMKLKARYVIFSCIDFYKDLEDSFGFFLLPVMEGNMIREKRYVSCVF